MQELKNERVRMVVFFVQSNRLIILIFKLAIFIFKCDRFLFLLLLRNAQTSSEFLFSLLEIVLSIHLPDALGAIWHSNPIWF